MDYQLVDSKSGPLQHFPDIGGARLALSSWILKQRGAGETVVEQPHGQWSDSRVTIWIANESGDVLRLSDRAAPPNIRILSS
jgi:hypothetical protein